MDITFWLVNGREAFCFRHYHRHHHRLCCCCFEKLIPNPYIRSWPIPRKVAQYFNKKQKHTHTQLNSKWATIFVMTSGQQHSISSPHSIALRCIARMLLLQPDPFYWFFIRFGICAASYTIYEMNASSLFCHDAIIIMSFNSASYRFNGLFRLQWLNNFLFVSPFLSPLFSSMFLLYLQCIWRWN